jgi:hydrogenase expression/formation protein HypD
VKYIDEYRDAGLVRKVSEELHRLIRGKWTIMEICGGQTHAIMRYQLEEFLPAGIRLVHGPGCPVCVTPLDTIDKAIYLAKRDDVILASYGDMLRVPGTGTDLLSVKATGGDVRMVYSPLDALKIAGDNRDKEVVFLAIGFETTAPANALSVKEARRRGLENYSILSSHVLVPPAMKAILSSPSNNIQGFLAAGHVCTVMGYEEYIPVASEYNVPVVITGFEPVDIMKGILFTIRQLENQEAKVENAYGRAVTREGNLRAKELLSEVFTLQDQTWRGIGMIPDSGLGLSAGYRAFDAENRFDLSTIKARENSVCIAGQILQGLREPDQCQAFGEACTPEHPIGAPMVSSEGACSAYYRFRKSKIKNQ